MFANEFEKSASLVGSAFGLATGVAKSAIKGTAKAGVGIAKGVGKAAVKTPGVVAKAPGALVRGTGAMAKETWNQVNSPLGAALTAGSAIGTAGGINHAAKRPIGVNKGEYESLNA